MASESYGAVVIGSGPGGYVCGIRLGQLGVKTLVVERESPGGVCLNVGCIPSKALIYAAKTYDKLKHSSDIGINVKGNVEADLAAMQEWKSGVVSKLTNGVSALLKSAKAELVSGTARIASRTQEGYQIEIAGKDTRKVVTKNVVLATGSRPISIPGFDIDNEMVIDSTGALALTSLPERMVVIGGGYIGLELGTVYAKLGTKVTVVEMMDSVLAGMDKDCVQVVAKKLSKMGIEVILNARAKSLTKKGKRAVVEIHGSSGSASIDADKVLVSVGRKPNSNDLGLEALGVRMEKGYVQVDKQLRTNVPGIYGIGDLVGGMMLAHKASKEAEVVAELIAGHKAAFDVRTIPAVVFTDPEIASTGMTEAEAKAAGREVKVGKFPFAALGRALSVNDTEGFAKIVIDAKTDEILGAHIVGNGASDLISEIALGIEMGAVARDVALTVHPHPTLSEALMEASAAALGEAVHIVNR
jgi:dihydrolipoamide dehydrogenase